MCSTSTTFHYALTVHGELRECKRVLGGFGIDALLQSPSVRRLLQIAFRRDGDADIETKLVVTGLVSSC